MNHPLYSSSNTQEDIQHTTTESKANFPEYSHKNCSNLSGFYRGHLITCSAKDSINQLLYEGMDAHEIQTGSNGHSYHEQTLNHIL
ncbi:MAG: hypothetical protein HYZ54_01620 [Ignavibacteriae bacterium]|nr:hypothetical protein [Ignavibacteriota bacterium]